MSLILDLLRHAEAVPDHPTGDSLRPLSRAGEKALRVLGARLKAEGWRPGRAFSSPLRRARQSAELLLAAAGLGLHVETMAELAPEANPPDTIQAVAQAVAEEGGVWDGHILLVAHQPLLGRLTAHLTGTEARFPPGGLVRIECPASPGPGSGRIALVIAPG